ncbi:MAG: hypothetical protein J6T10_19805 [Methanobrevibacter sp.]|nr:hypothetical protein [Methanobrevibacter sp.]MBO7694867.1 hypothetical protein [Methanobrevibacter sp.]
MEVTTVSPHLFELSVVGVAGVLEDVSLIPNSLAHVAIFLSVAVAYQSAGQELLEDAEV